MSIINSNIDNYYTNLILYILEQVEAQNRSDYLYIFQYLTLNLFRVRGVFLGTSFWPFCFLSHQKRLYLMFNVQYCIYRIMKITIILLTRFFCDNIIGGVSPDDPGNPWRSWTRRIVGENSNNEQLRLIHVSCICKKMIDENER